MEPWPAYRSCWLWSEGQLAQDLSVIAPRRPGAPCLRPDPLGFGRPTLALSRRQVRPVSDGLPRRTADSGLGWFGSEGLTNWDANGISSSEHIGLPDQQPLSDERRGPYWAARRNFL